MVPLVYRVSPRRFWRWLRREDDIDKSRSEGYGHGLREASYTVVEFAQRGGRIAVPEDAFLMNTVTLGMDGMIVRPESQIVITGMQRLMYSVKKRAEFDAELAERVP